MGCGRSWGSTNDANSKRLKIQLKVKARAKERRVEKVAEGRYKVWVKAVPERGKANEAVIEAMSEHLGVPKSRISLVMGQTSSRKVLEVG